MSDRESARQKRLSEALRENLKRRKIQSRERAAPPQVRSESKNDPAESSDDEAEAFDPPTDRLPS
jgi:hypothetical protein